MYITYSDLIQTGIFIRLEGSSLPDERKEGCPMVTYADLFQFCIFIVALVGLVYQIFKDKRK